LNTFQDSPLVAIFKTKIGATSRITKVEPLCFVKGFPHEVPNCIQFYQNCQEESNFSILTIAWSNGFIQHFPIIDCDYKESHLNVSKNVGVMSNTFSVTEDLQTSIYTSFSFIQ
jgi:hypothetical protein